MRVRIELVVDIDAEAWSREYGIEVEGVRNDVKNYVQHSVDAHLTEMGLTR